jgi:hypothetical protein
MANGHGGARPGAGRKTDAQIAKLRTLVKNVMSDDDWLKIIKGVVDDARSGDLRSVSFLLALRYGVSAQSLVAAEAANLVPSPTDDADLNPAPAGTRP